MILQNLTASLREKPLFTRFAVAYFSGGLLLIFLVGLFRNVAAAGFVLVNWIAVGISVALIAYGLPRKSTDPRAGFAYLLGIGWLVLLLIGGIVLFWQQGIGVAELQWLME